MCSLGAEGKAKWKRIQQRENEQYLTLPHFGGLKCNTHEELHKEVHKAHCFYGINALPKITGGLALVFA